MNPAIKKADLWRIGAVAAGLLVVWFNPWRVFGAFDLIGTAVVLTGGYPIFREAVTDLWSRRMTMELSMTIALAAALAIGESFTALLIVFFVLIVEVLEHLTVEGGRRAIKDLLNLLPNKAEIVRDESTEQVRVSEIPAAARVLVRPGANVPVDGQVLEGESYINEAAITGEPLPALKVLDKTGTVTAGRPVVTGLDPETGITERDLLCAAAGAEALSEHLIAEAIRTKAAELSVPILHPEHFRYFPGRGITCTISDERVILGTADSFRSCGLFVPSRTAGSLGKSVILVGKGNRFLGSIEIADELRRESRQAVHDLRQLKIRSVLMTGDNREAAGAIGKALAVDEIMPELLPTQKQEQVEDLRRRGFTVANFIGTIVVDSIGMGLPAAGDLAPVPPVIIHVVSELVFILNSARLLPRLVSKGERTVSARARRMRSAPSPINRTISPAGMQSESNPTDWPA